MRESVSGRSGREAEKRIVRWRVLVSSGCEGVRDIWERSEEHCASERRRNGCEEEYTASDKERKCKVG